MSKITELCRCERELAEIAAMAAEGNVPAWLVALGENDWRVEMRLIEEEKR